MSKNKEKIKLQNGKEVEVHTDFYLEQIVEAIETSEGIYAGIAHKMVAASTLTMLFDMFALSDFIENKEITKEDYKQWFEKPAKAIGADKFIYFKIFGEDKDGK